MLRIAGWFKRRMRTGFGSGTAATMALDYVNGPADGVSTDNALVRWDATTGRLVQNSNVTLSDAGAMAWTATGGSLSLPNVIGANSESVLVSWVANELVIATQITGTGTNRGIRLKTSAYEVLLPASGAAGLLFTGSSSGTFAIAHATNGVAIAVQGQLTTQAGPALILRNGNQLTGTNLVQTMVGVTGTLNQSSTAGYKAFQVNVTETATGSGQKDLLSLEVGGAVRRRTDNNGKQAVFGTITAGGTTGNQTINRPTGTVNVAAAGTGAVVTNSLVTANSLVRAFLRTNDTTAKSAVAVAAAGSFEIFLNAAATAEVSVGFEVEEVA